MTARSETDSTATSDKHFTIGGKHFTIGHSDSTSTVHDPNTPSRPSPRKKASSYNPINPDNYSPNTYYS